MRRWLATSFHRARPLAKWIDRVLTTMTSHRWLTTSLAAIILTGLTLRVGYAVFAVQIDPMLNGDPLMGDAASYDRIARGLVSGHGFSEYPPTPSMFWPPGYPTLLAGIYSVFGHNLLAARVVNALLGALTPIVVYMFASRLIDQRAGLLAAIGASLYPLLIALGAWLIADGPYVLLVAVIMLLATMLHQDREPLHRARLAAFGAALGIAFLFKPVTAFFLPFITLWILLAWTQIPLRNRLASGLLVAAVFALVLTPWEFRNYGVTGQLIIGSTNGGYTFYGANNEEAFGGHYEHFPPRIPGLSDTELQQEYYRLGMTWIRENPAGFARLQVKKFRRLVSPLSIASSPDDLSLPGDRVVRAAYALFLGSVVAGAALLAPQRRVLYVLGIPILAVITSTFVFYGDARYTLPAVPSLLVLSAVGCDWVVRKAAGDATL